MNVVEQLLPYGVTVQDAARAIEDCGHELVVNWGRHEFHVTDLDLSISFEYAADFGERVLDVFRARSLPGI